MVPDYIPAVLADSPAAFWQLQDIADFPQDSSGNGKHMDTDAIASGVGGTTTYAVQYGPMSSVYVRLNRSLVARSADSVLSAVDNVTMEIWVQQLTLGNSTQPFFWIGGNNGVGTGLGTNSWGLRAPQVGSVNTGPQISVLNGGTLASSVNSSNAAWLSAVWTHIVAVRRAGTWELWQNGVQDTSIGTFTGAPGAGATSAAIGFANTSFVQSSHVAFAALYNVPLSPTRIVAHYNAMWQWENAQPILDEQPTAVAAGAFTTKGNGGLMPNTPPAFAEYEELSWLSTGDVEVDYASGGGGSAFV